MKEKEFIDYIRKTINERNENKEKKENNFDVYIEEARINIEKMVKNEKTEELIDNLKDEVPLDRQEEVLKVFTDEQIKKFEKNVFGTAVSYFSHSKVDWGKVNSLADLKNVVKDIMPAEEFDKRFALVKGIPANDIIEKADTILPIMAKGLPEDKMKKMVDNANNFTPYSMREVEDVSTKRFEREIKDIEKDKKYKRILGEKSKKSEELKHAMAYADSLRKGNSKFDAEIETSKSIMENIISKRTKEVSSNKREEAYNFVNNEIDIDYDGEVLETKNLPGVEDVTVDVITDSKYINNIENSKLTYTDETKENLRKMFKKMEEFGYYNEGPFEEEEKENVYGFSKLDKARSNLDKALKEKNYDNIIKFSNEHEKESKQINLIFGMMENSMPTQEENIDFSLNSDVSKNDNFEIDIRGSISESAQFNGLYSVLSSIKRNGMTVDEYLENPRKLFEIEANKTLSNLDIDLSTKGKSLGQAIFQLSKNSVGNNVESNINHNKKLMESAVRFENDKKTRESNYLAEKDYSDSTLKKMESQSKIADNLTSKDTELFKNMLITGGKMDPSQLATTATYDSKTMQLKEPAKFDRGEYISRNNIDLKEFRNNLNKAMIDFMAEYQKNGASEKTNNMTPDAFVKMSQQLAYEVCLLKKDQKLNKKDMEEYNKLAKFTSNPVEYMNNLIASQKGAIKFQAKPDKVENLSKDEKKYDKFLKKNNDFGKDIRNKDKAFNEKLISDLKTIQNAQKKNNAELETATREKLEESIKNRKDELEKEFKEGKITESYYKERKDQLNAENLIDSFNKDKKIADVPKMFKADKFPSKEDYIKSTGLEDLSNEERDTLYEQAKDNAKKEKEDFLTRKFLEDKKFIDPNRPRCTMGEMEKAIEDHEKEKDDLEVNNIKIDDEKEKDVNKEEKKEKDEPQIEKIHVDLEEEVLEPTEMIPKKGKEVQKEKMMGI